MVTGTGWYQEETAVGGDYTKSQSADREEREKMSQDPGLEKTVNRRGKGGTSQMSTLSSYCKITKIGVSNEKRCVYVYMCIFFFPLRKEARHYGQKQLLKYNLKLAEVSFLQCRGRINRVVTRLDRMMRKLIKLIVC